MNNATKTVTEVGQLARGLISDGLMVNAEIAAEEPAYDPKGLDEALLKLVNRYGAEMVLASIHDAACGAAEVHEDCSEFDDEHYGVVAVRLKVFCRKLDAAIKTLR